MQYTVQGQRADSSGPRSPIFVVNFGRAPGGGMTASVTSGVRDGIRAPAAGAREATPSTVDGRVVQKTLPSVNGSATQARV